MADDGKRDMIKWAKSMDVEVSELRRAMNRYGLDESDMVNVDKRGLLAKAIENKWSQDEWKGQYRAYTKANPTADFDWSQVVEQYGFSLGILQKYRDELKPIFTWLANKLAKGETLDNLRNDFYKKVDDAGIWENTIEMEADLNRFGAQKDDFKDNLLKLTREIRRIAKVKYGDQMLDQLDEGEARKLALNLVYGWSGFLTGNFDEQIIVRSLRPYNKTDLDEGNEPDDDTTTGTDDVQGGQQGNLRRELLSWLSANNVTLDDTRLVKYLDQMMAGEWTFEQVKQDVRNRNFTVDYAQYSDLFKQGTDLSDIAMSYRQRAANLLEVDIDSIGITDPMVQTALGFTLEGKPASMPMYEFEKQVRKSDAWNMTDQAMEQYTDLGETILRNFGFRG